MRTVALSAVPRLRAPCTAVYACSAATIALAEARYINLLLFISQ
jgi:hypothetical protein